jgi:predicted DNA-binding ribbon-helix-helix protein
MKTDIVKRSIVVFGHKTSVSVEDLFWYNLKEIAKSNRATLSNLIEQIDSNRQYGNLSSAIRLFVLEHGRGLVAKTEIGGRRYVSALSGS